MAEDPKFLKPFFEVPRCKKFIKALLEDAAPAIERLTQAKEVVSKLLRRLPIRNWKAQPRSLT